MVCTRRKSKRVGFPACCGSTVVDAVLVGGVKRGVIEAVSVGGVGEGVEAQIAVSAKGFSEFVVSKSTASSE